MDEGSWLTRSTNGRRWTHTIVDSTITESIRDSIVLNRSFDCTCILTDFVLMHGGYLYLLLFATTRLFQAIYAHVESISGIVVGAS